ncbi:MAG: hypothetical protein J6K58_06755 [Lachnospiraceae bacterium]|nr:hypothetical protein [Lachnospiraceae bacterium]MBP3458891.1 hypothetical protein [Lachnospiraceae bacterium]
MIVFVGKRERGFFCEEIARKREVQCVYIPENLYIEEQAKEILRYKEKAKAIIYDLEQYVDESEILEDWILKIQEAIGIQTIIFAAGYLPQSKIVNDLYHKGIRNFIFSVFLGEQKEDLELALDGYFEHFGYEKRGIVFEETEPKEAAGQENNEIKKSIGLAGAVARMGTTTQAIQFVKHLQFTGYQAAYVQMNGHHWVEELAEAYSEAEQDTDEGRVTYQFVDMYYRLDKLQDVLKKQYDFLVYDYGVYSEHDFNKISFCEKDIQVFVVGSKPGEFEKTYEVISNNFYNSVYYIFNFVAKAEQKDLLELMEEKAVNTFFAQEARDPFAYAGQSEVFEKMLPLEAKAMNDKKKTGFFWKWKGRKEG